MDKMDKPLASVILLPVPEAEPIVKMWREKYDRVATLGIPAHITLLFPFITPSSIDQKVLDKLHSFFQHVKPFRFSLTAIGTFPSIIFLTPDSRDPFVALTKDLTNIFPENPPYGGRFPQINPHLTLGQLGQRGDFQEILDNMSKDITSKLPLQTNATEAWLMVEHRIQTWSVLMKFDFGKK